MTSSKLTDFFKNSSQQYLMKADKEICYLCDSKYLAIYYSDIINEIFQIFNDIAFNDDLQIRCSTQSYLLILFDKLIDWKSEKQWMMITSTIETELMTLFFVIKELYIWMRLFKQLNFNSEEKFFILCDNHQTVSLMMKKKSQITIKLRHVFINTH